MALTKGDGGMFAGSTSCGMLVHVLTQWYPSCRLSTATTARPCVAGEKSARTAKAVVKIEAYPIVSDFRLLLAPKRRSVLLGWRCTALILFRHRLNQMLM
jgi:hypothetical protein